MPPSRSFPVNTAQTLDKVQRALELGRRTNNIELTCAAESVLSRLVLDLRNRTAMLPEELAPMLRIVDSCVLTSKLNSGGLREHS